MQCDRLEALGVLIHVLLSGMQNYLGTSISVVESELLFQYLDKDRR